MRVWDIPVQLLCWVHLNGQHREIHGIVGSIKNYYNKGSKGYSNHPETKRWIGHEDILLNMHELTANEMLKRGRNHRSPIEKFDYVKCDNSLIMVDSIEDQIQNIFVKSEDPNHGCNCNVALINHWFIKNYGVSHVKV